MIAPYPAVVGRKASFYAPYILAPIVTQCAQPATPPGRRATYQATIWNPCFAMTKTPGAPPRSKAPVGCWRQSSDYRRKRDCAVTSNVVPLHIQKRWGATDAEWTHFDLVLGLTEHLLPVVSNPGATISERSKMKGLGKTPSWYNRDRQVAGIADWSERRTTTAEIDRWCKESDYGVCIQARAVRAIDVDVPDAQAAARIRDCLARELGAVPCRRRANSGKFLVAFRLDGVWPKRSFPVEGGVVEFLGDGQQFIAAGTHPSGARYEWVGGLPDFPVLTPEQFELVWSRLVAAFATGEERRARERRDRVPREIGVVDDRSAWLEANATTYGWGGQGQLFVECPYKSGHSSDSGETECAYFPAGTGGYAQGHWSCLHASCSGRSDAEFDEGIGYNPVAEQFAALAAEGVSGGETHARFRFLPASEFVKGAPPSWWIKGVLPQVPLGMIYGPSGAGKSFFALDMVASIALGRVWREKPVVPGRVAYVCAEGAGGFMRRIRAYEHHHGVAFGDDLLVLAAQPNLLATPDTRDLVSAIEQSGAALIVIDTLAQVTPGGDENSAVDMGTALKACREIEQQTGASVLLVHHAGKDVSRGARGWSGLRAAVDYEIEVSRNGEQRAATVTKMKDGEDGQAFGFRLLPVVLGVDSDGDEITSCVVEHIQAVVDRSKGRLGKWHRLVLDAFEDEIGLVDSVGVDRVLDRAVEREPMVEGKRDRRREYALRALDALAKSGHIDRAVDTLRRPPEPQIRARESAQLVHL